jgi:hypothetical protein
VRPDQGVDAQTSAQPIEQQQSEGGDEPERLEALKARQVLSPVFGEEEGGQEAEDGCGGEDNQPPAQHGDRNADDIGRTFLAHRALAASVFTAGERVAPSD